MVDSQMSSSQVKDGLVAGYKEQLPLNFGVVPFGLVFGAYAISIGITPLQTIALSVLINAGSSQIAALGLLVNGVSPLIIILSIGLINLRFMLYSATWAGLMHDINRRWKFLLSYWLTDATFVLVTNKYHNNTPVENLWFSLGVGFGQWSAWIGSCILGVILGSIIPASLSLEFALPLLFIALLIGHLISLPIIVAALVSGIVAIVLINLPHNLGLLISILLGIATGLYVEHLNIQFTKRPSR